MSRWRFGDRSPAPGCHPRSVWPSGAPASDSSRLDGASRCHLVRSRSFSLIVRLDRAGFPSLCQGECVDLSAASVPVARC